MGVVLTWKNADAVVSCIRDGGKMAWITGGTLAAALIAVFCVVQVCAISRRRYSTDKEPAGPNLPVVVAYPAVVDDHPDWTRITVEMRNRAAVPIELISIGFTKPANGKLLLEDQVRKNTGLNREPRPMLETFPAGLASKRVAASAYLSRIDPTNRYEPGEFAYVTVYAHLPLSRFEKEPRPRLNLEMRWRDRTAKTFAMAVNVIKPKTA